MYRRRMMQLREDSPLRKVDPRIKLALAIALALAIMLPIERLAVFLVVLVGLLGVARLLREAGHQALRVLPLVILLFALDWLCIGLAFAVLITLRILLLVAISVLLVSTTTPEEFRLALVSLGMPQRYAFILSLAFQAIPLLQGELRAIWEAQRARGLLPERRGWRSLPAQVNDWVALVVPAVVLTARRAWALTEAAHARGFGSPHHLHCRTLRIGWQDWALLGGAVMGVGMLILIR